MEENVILVNENDNEIGQAEKMAAHKEGKLHRAFSIFVFNDKKELMLQKREQHKYHSGGLWTNTCCSHPRPGEDLMDAAHRRLQEEMGFGCELKEIFHFTYSAQFEGLSEYEVDHVMFGRYNDKPKLNSEEAEDWKWINLDDLNNDIEKNPDNYTVWFKIAMEEINKHIRGGSIEI